MLAAKDASQRKVRVGRPKIDEKLKDLVVKLYNEDEPIDNIIDLCGISRRSIFNIIKERRKENPVRKQFEVNLDFNFEQDTK